MRTLIFLAFTLAAFAASGNDADNARTMDQLSPAAARTDIALARRALEQLHAGYDRYVDRSDLDVRWGEMAARLGDSPDRGALYLELSRLLASLRCDHTKAELPDDMARMRNKSPVYLPFGFVVFEHRIFVDRSDPGTGLSRGEEVLSIDGKPAGQWLDAVYPLIPVDGDNDHVKPLVAAYGTEFMGGALDHFAPFLEPVGETVVLEVRSGDGRVRTIELKRLTFPEYQALVGKTRYAENFSDAISFRRLGADAAYLAVDTFVNYRDPVDPGSTLAPYFERLSAENRSRLVLDLRENGGGSTDAQSALLRFLTDRPVQEASAIWTRFDRIDPEIRRHLDTWQKPALNPDPGWFEDLGNGNFRLVPRELGAPGGPTLPAAGAFSGELVVLIGPKNSSGATHLLSVLKSAGIGTLVGEKTGGAPTGATAGLIYFLTLPESGIRIRIPAQRTVMANAADLPKRDGIEPDVIAVQTAESYFAGRDVALSTALELLGMQPGHEYLGPEYLGSD